MQLQLTESTAQEYFRNIFELEQVGEAFPVDLDEVWGLVYKRRNEAIRELRKNFIEGVDYNLSQNAKVLKNSELVNGIKIEAKLSVSCLEYFVVRKVRAVFEVYRKCRQIVQSEFVNDPIISMRLKQIEAEKRLTVVEDRQDNLESKVDKKLTYEQAKRVVAEKESDWLHRQFDLIDIEESDRFKERK